MICMAPNVIVLDVFATLTITACFVLRYESCIILLLSRGNFCAEEQHSDKVLPFGARWSGNYASPLAGRYHRLLIFSDVTDRHNLACGRLRCVSMEIGL